MKIAVIGTGISGLGAAWLLNRAHDIAVYEADTRLGGHSRTINLNVNGGQVPVDTGFIVYNERNYPNLVALFKLLDVPTSPSDMSFGASIQNGMIEYGSKGIFAQKTNLLRLKFWGMLFDILAFNRKATAYLEASPDVTLRTCLEDLGMGDWFKRYYLQAMGAAIWSCSVETILDFPAATFIRFFQNHGLLTVNGHPQWRTVTGGSREYIKRLTAGYADKIRLGCGAVSVVRGDGGVFVTDTSGECLRYDHVFLACHADAALKMLGNPTDDERQILGAFRYQPNRVVVHSDISFMPKTRGSWASWVYLSEGMQDQNPSVSLTYWMNNLQPLATDTPVLVTLNPARMPAPELVYDTHSFDHPVFDTGAIKAQARMPEIQGKDRISYCGAYQCYGFHEDGLLSAVRAVEGIGCKVPWL